MESRQPDEQRCPGIDPGQRNSVGGQVRRGASSVIARGIASSQASLVDRQSVGVCGSPHGHRSERLIGAVFVAVEPGGVLAPFDKGLALVLGEDEGEGGSAVFAVTGEGDAVAPAGAYDRAGRCRAAPADVDLTGHSVDDHLVGRLVFLAGGDEGLFEADVGAGARRAGEGRAVVDEGVAGRRHSRPT